MQNARQFSKSGAFRLEKIGEIYKDYFKYLNWPKNGNVNVMDIGCADGEVSTKILYPLLPKNVSEFVCVDVDDAMISHCKTLQVDKKVAFKKLDVTSENLAEDFKKRFDFLFSSYCFTSVRNFRQSLHNSRELLKSNGELLYFFMYKKNHLLTTYKRLSEMKTWNPYTSEFSDFVPHFSSDNPESELRAVLGKTGFDIIAHEFRHKCYYEATARSHLGIYLSVDTISSRIPANQKTQYTEDFKRILSEETEIDFMNENELDKSVDLHIPTVIFTARKTAGNQ